LDLFFATIALNLFSNGILGVGKVWAIMGYIALGGWSSNPFKLVMISFGFYEAQQYF